MLGKIISQTSLLCLNYHLQSWSVLQIFPPIFWLVVEFAFQLLHLLVSLSGGICPELVNFKTLMLSSISNMNRDHHNLSTFIPFNKSVEVHKLWNSSLLQSPHPILSYAVFSSSSSSSSSKALHPDVWSCPLATVLFMTLYPKLLSSNTSISSSFLSPSPFRLSFYLLALPLIFYHHFNYIIIKMK